MFTKSQSKTKPLAVENVGNDRYIIRQNITENDDGNGGKENERILCGGRLNIRK